MKTVPAPPVHAFSAVQAAGWMVASIASFLLMTIAARELSGRLSTVEILCFRSIVALAVLLALRPRLGARAYETRRLPLHLVRNAIHFFGQYGWVWGIALAPLSVVTAIEFTTPVWVALLAGLFLRERISLPRGVAIAGGVAGLAIIVRPGASAFGPAAVIVLAGALCFATSIVLVKELLRTDPVTAVIFYMSLIQLPIGLVGSLFVWVWPRWTDLPWIIAVGVTSLTAHYAMGRALSLADVSFVLPIDFLRLPCIALAGLVLYREPIDAPTIVGALAIFAGNYWSVRSEMRGARSARTRSVVETAAP